MQIYTRLCSIKNNCLQQGSAAFFCIGPDTRSTNGKYARVFTTPCVNLQIRPQIKESTVQRHTCLGQQWTWSRANAPHAYPAQSQDPTWLQLSQNYCLRVQGKLVSCLDMLFNGSITSNGRHSSIQFPRRHRSTRKSSTSEIPVEVVKSPNFSFQFVPHGLFQSFSLGGRLLQVFVSLRNLLNFCFQLLQIMV